MEYDKLIKIFEEEREKLGLKETNIKIKFLTPPPIEYYESFKQWWAFFDSYSTGVIKNDDGSFLIQFHPLSYKTEKKFRKTVRHELYHIFHDGDKNIVNFWRYLFISEPLAMLYSYFGIKSKKNLKRRNNK
ncbi:MAG: hypothetical protein QXD48_02915 [Candidatus Aenigmatarchaeota archaeon]